MSKSATVLLMDFAASDPILEVQAKLSQYDPRAFAFVYGAIEFVVGEREEPGHITGPELAQGVLGLARGAFGLMAPLVLESWGIRRSEDIGEIVFALVEAKLMGQQESDRKEDFDGLFTVEDAFQGEYEWKGVKPRIEAWQKEPSVLKFS